MTTPLQKAAQALFTAATEEEWYEGYSELRKALDAELAQSVEPVAWWVVSKTTVEKFVSTRPDDWSSENWEKRPLYLHPPQPQATTSLPAEVLEAIRRSGHALVKTKFGYRLNFIGAATAQGEKP